MTNVWEKWVGLQVKAENFKAQTFAENGGLHADPHPNLGLFAGFEQDQLQLKPFGQVTSAPKTSHKHPHHFNILNIYI